jgi:hypothetical protein
MDPRPSLPPGARPRIDWRRLTRSPRGAAGLVIVAAALLLWPFAGLSWIPWLIGLAVLVLIHLVRLDGLLRGWAPHVAGLAVVIGLMMSTGPWAWALAVSIGVLLAGLAQLPWWRLAAVGAVLCVISGTGFTFAAIQARADRAEQFIRDGDAVRPQIAEVRDDVLLVLIEAVDSAQPDPQPVCRLLSQQASTQLIAALRVPTCEDGVTAMHRRLGAAAPGVMNPRQLPKPAGEPDQSRMVIDACSTRWTAAAGLGLGRIHIERTSPTSDAYIVSSFSACS